MNKLIPLSKIIILEGPDNTGKTTLAGKLEAKYHYHYAHHGAPNPGEDLLVTYGTAIQRARRRDHPTVFDRLHLGEMVYGAVLRGGSKLEGRGHWLLDMLLKAAGADVHICMERFDPPRGKPNHGYTPEQEAKIWKLYSDLCQIYHSVSAKHVEFVTPAPVLTMPTYAIGVPHLAKYLFIGEQANQELDLPFFALNASSGFLHDCLLQAGYMPQEMAFMNILDRTGRVNSILDAACALPHLLCCVALGGEARKKLDETPLDAAHLLHPQFVKRFRNKNRDHYVDQLRGIREDHR